MKAQFVSHFYRINENFSQVFSELFGGGTAEVNLEDEQDVLSCGIEIKAQPPGKKLQNLLLLSGGERCVTAIALLFAILKLRPTPFCVLDEVEAALDDANVMRFTTYIRRYARRRSSSSSPTARARWKPLPPYASPCRNGAFPASVHAVDRLTWRRTHSNGLTRYIPPRAEKDPRLRDFRLQRLPPRWGISTTTCWTSGNAACSGRCRHGGRRGHPRAADRARIKAEGDNSRAAVMTALSARYCGILGDPRLLRPRKGALTILLMVGVTER